MGLVIVIALGAAATLTFETVTSNPGPRPGGTSLTAGFPPAHLADSSFTTDPAQQARGIHQALTRIVAANGTIVAVGSQSGARLQRAQFFVSSDGGHTWRVAPTRAVRGGDPPPGHVPMFVAGGQGAWLALGSDSLWTSSSGTSWTLSAAHGIAPQRAGDEVWVVTRTSSGFLAGGRHLPARGGGPGTAVIWTSHDGVNWQRRDAAHLGPVAGGGHIASVNYAAAHGSDTVIAGETVKKRAARSGEGTVVTHSFGVWRSTDGGATWTPVNVPVDNGAQDMVSGVAATADAFVVVRPGRSRGAGTDAVSYVSADGSGWGYGGQIGAHGKAGFASSVVKGSENGFVVCGRTGGGRLIAFFSADGRSWRQVGDFGSAASEQLSSATTAPGGTVVAVGASARDSLSQRPIIALASPGRRVTPVNVGGIPHASDPELSVNSVADAAGERVAVGSANGMPAVWSARGGGSWLRVSGGGALARPGAQALTGVTHGTAGWLAVGWVVALAPEHPIVVTSRDGAVWQAADGQSAFAAAGAYTFQAAANPSGYVVVGERIRGTQSVAAAWWSTGLSTWQPAVDAGNGDLDGTGASRQMLAVTATPSGFTAVGSHGFRPAVWTSTNGRQWLLSDLPLPPGATSAVLTQVAAHGGHVVAMGSGTGASGTVPFAAVSADGGRSWHETALPRPDGPASLSVTALAAGARGFTAAGVAGTEANGDVVIWSSADGRVWKAVKPVGTGLSGRGLQEITGLAASGSALTGVGFTASPLGEHPTLWAARQR